MRLVGIRLLIVHAIDMLSWLKHLPARGRKVPSGAYSTLGSLSHMEGVQATKEAEHRERLSELKTRIDSGKDRLATEESSRRAAKVHIWSGAGSIILRAGIEAGTFDPNQMCEPHELRLCMQTCYCTPPAGHLVFDKGVLGHGWHACVGMILDNGASLATQL